MLKYIRSLYRLLLGILFWIVLIAFILAGLFLGEEYFGSETQGAIIGAIIGSLILVLVGGHMATFLNIDNNLEKIVNELQNRREYENGLVTNNSSTEKEKVEDESEVEVENGE